MVRDDQPDAREGQAGRLGVAERSVVPMKPGNAGGGKGPWFKTDARRRKGREIGQPINSEECSETTEGVTRESEGGIEQLLDAPGSPLSDQRCPR